MIEVRSLPHLSDREDQDSPRGPDSNCEETGKPWDERTPRALARLCLLLGRREGPLEGGLHALTIRGLEHGDTVFHLDGEGQVPHSVPPFFDQVGLVDAHLHIESSMLTPTEFAKAALVHGTTAMFVDPHEIANVRKDGIELFLKVAEKLPLDMYVGIPSCVPATHLEDAGAEVKLEDIKALIDHPRVYGLAEMMNFPGVIHGFGDARAKVDLVYAKGKIVDGHAPGLSGEALVSYITNGRNDGVIRIMSDHESTGYEEALEKSEAGMYVALRYGRAAPADGLSALRREIAAFKL